MKEVEEFPNVTGGPGRPEGWIPPEALWNGKKWKLTRGEDWPDEWNSEKAQNRVGAAAHRRGWKIKTQRDKTDPDSLYVQVVGRKIKTQSS